MGRITSLETRKRTARFLELCADGHPANEAAHLSHISATRALDLVSSPLFPDVLKQIRHARYEQVAA